MTKVQSKPLIRWAGSKRKLLPLLLDKAPLSYQRYVEPFCGSASLFFEMPKMPALLSDINSELMNAFNAIKSDPYIREKLVSLDSTKDEYYRVRELDPSSLNDNDRAVRFLYLNRYCFNGVYRTNQKGKFNVPMGTRTGNFPKQEVFDKAREHLSNTELLVSDYKDTLSKLKEGDFAYIDPPYSKAGRFTGEYGIGSFDSAELPDFYDNLLDLDQKGVQFLFSYKACAETIELLSDRYFVEEVSVKRHVSGFKKNWNEAKEILVKNYG